MDALKQQVRDINFSNWLDVAVGISVTTKGISEYLEGSVRALHHKIKYGACAQLPICRRNCSKTQRNLSTWCRTCMTWKGQMMLYHRHNTGKIQIQWKEINSSDWSQNVDEMVKVYAPQWWRARTPFTEDISVGLHVFHNCTEFNIPFPTYQRVRDIRNALFAHGQLQVSNDEKKAALKNLITFLKLPEISQAGSCQVAISQLKRLKSKCVIDLMTEDKVFKHYLELALNPHKEAERDVLNHYEHVQEMRLCLRKDPNFQLEKVSAERARFVGGVNGNWLFGTMTAIAIILAIILLNIGNRDDTNLEGLNKEKSIPVMFLEIK